MNLTMATCPESGKALASAVIAPLAVLLVFLSVVKLLPSFLTLIVMFVGFCWADKFMDWLVRIPERRLERIGAGERPHPSQEEPTPTKRAGSGPWLEIID